MEKYTSAYLRAAKEDELNSIRITARYMIELDYLRFINGATVDLNVLQLAFDTLMKVEAELVVKKLIPGPADQKLDREAAEHLAAMKLNQRPGDEKPLPPHTLTVNMPEKKSIKIERERIPRFSGLYSEYTVFMRIFGSLVDKNNDIDVETKERYLLEHLDGKARAHIVPYIGKPESYASMMKALKEHYETGKNVKDHLKEEVEKLPKMNFRYDDKLLEFKDSVIAINNAAKQTVQTGDDFHRTLYTLVTARFADKIRNQLVRDCANVDELITKFKKWLDEKERLVNSGMFRSPHRSDAYERPTTSRPRDRFRTAIVATRKSCAFCKGEHFHSECKHVMEPNRRKEIAARERLCFQCLRYGHRANDDRCPRRGLLCNQCQGKHHPLICQRAPNRRFSEERAASDQQTPLESQPSTSRGTSGYIRCIDNRIANLGRAGVVTIHSFTNGTHFLRASLNNVEITILLDTGSDHTLIARFLTQPRDVFRGRIMYMEGIGGTSPTDEMTKIMLTHSQSLPVIEVVGYVLDRLPGVDLILGRNDIAKILKPDALDNGRAYMDTIYGRVYYSDGAERSSMTSNVAYIRRVAMHNEPPAMTKSLIEELTGKEEEINTPLENKQQVNGRYRAWLPFLPGPRPSNNFFNAKRRLDRLRARLMRTPGLLEKYEDQLFAYVRDGHAVSVPDVECPWSDAAFYLPHREVIKDSKTTAFRIVFDASASDLSLNQCLFKGRADQLCLPNCLMQFRKHAVAVVADISKAFLQIEVADEHQDYLRFLWQQGDTLQVLKMCRLPFGLVSSPAILIDAINKQIEKYRQIYPTSAQKLSESFYMDDLVSSTNTVPEAEKLRAEALEIFNDAHFELSKWNSSDASLRNKWTSAPNEVEKILGIDWNINNDVLSIRCARAELPNEITPRVMMQFIGSIFDVLGLAEPVKLRLKEMSREVMKQKITWDQPIPVPMAEEFSAHLRKLPVLSTITVPRFVSIPSMISIFCDASDRGYGYVIYTTDDQCQNFYLYGRSKLVPQKKRTTPELELAALTEAVENVPFLREHFPDASIPIVVWTDSSITLCRLKSHVNKHATYVTNRLMRVHRVCDEHPLIFRYVPTNLNPADVYSRPKTIDQLIELAPSQLNVNINSLLERAETANIPHVSINCAVKSIIEPLVDVPGFERIGEWIPMVHAAKHKIQLTFLVLRYHRRANVQDALTYLFRTIQSLCASELKKLKVPYITDDRGIIRVRTRNADDHPIWIPSNSRMATMIIRYYHSSSHHMRRRYTKAYVNEKFFIIGVNRIIDRVLRTCVKCQVAEKSRIQQPTGDLPPFRVSEFLPFECIGIDYFGPMKLGARSKCWVLIVTCSMSRAVHFEIVNDLTSSSCLLALTTTFNYRGFPRIVVSDNGRNFVATEKDLRRLRDLVIQAKDEIPEVDIRWYFNPPRASWWGGWFERMIGITKRALKKVTSPRNTTELRYVLAEIMAVINSRPLFASDSEADSVITPGHYISGRSFKSVPKGPSTLDSFKAYNQVKRWRRSFVRFWKSEYLRHLSLHYRKHKVTDISVGDLVLAQEQEEDKWSMAKVESIEKGADGVVRQVTLLYPDRPQSKNAKRVKRSNKRRILPRAVQSLVKLELDNAAPGECEGEMPDASSSMSGYTGQSSANVDTRRR